MGKRSLLIAASTAGVFALGLALPAVAHAADTPITLEVTGGGLSISAPVVAVSLGAQADTVGGTTVNGALGTVQVLDARAAAAGSTWTVNSISTALTPLAGPTIGAANIGYTVGPITKVGTATYIGTNRPGGLAGQNIVVAATGITGNNSATWVPTLNVTVPGGAVIGLYTGSITHSVA